MRPIFQTGASMAKSLSSLFAASFLCLLTSSLLCAQPHPKSPPAYKTKSRFRCTSYNTPPEHQRHTTECEKTELSKLGQPLMFPRPGSIAYGLSANPESPLELHIWIDNQTNAPVSYFVGCHDNFGDLFDVRNENGLSMDYLAELEREKRERESPLANFTSCTYNIRSEIPAHTWQEIEKVDFRNVRKLPSGSYFIFERATYLQSRHPVAFPITIHSDDSL